MGFLLGMMAAICSGFLAVTFFLAADITVAGGTTMAGSVMANGLIAIFFCVVSIIMLVAAFKSAVEGW